MTFRITAASAALSALALFASAEVSAQTTQNCSQSWYGSCTNIVSKTKVDLSSRPTTNNYAGNKTTLYAPPSMHMSGNSTAHCVKRWDFSISAWLAGVGVGIPQTDKVCMGIVARQVALQESAEERERIMLGRAMCADRMQPRLEREQVCKATHARVMALLATPAAPQHNKSDEGEGVGGDENHSVTTKPGTTRKFLADADTAFTR